MPAIAAKSKPREGVRQNELKWTKTLMDAGWTAFPSVILERQRALDLDPVDVNILMHLARHWWYSDKLPFPSKTTIAECMGISESTVQRHIAAMEKADYIRRIKRFDSHNGQRPNAYDLSGLIEAITPYAKEAITARKKITKENEERRKRKGLRIARLDENEN